jgi:hypothetical protein
MDIKFTIPDEDFKTLAINLKLILNTSESSKIEDQIGLLSKSAFYEYIAMIVGSGTANSVSGILQERILSLIKYYFGRFPTDREISRMFNIPLAKSRTLLNNLKAIYRNELREALNNSILAFIKTGVPTNNGSQYEFEVNSKSIIDEINDFIEVKKPGLDKFVRKQQCANKVIISKDTFDYLKAELLK